MRTTTDVSWTAWNELTPYYSDGVGNWTNGTFLLVGPMSGNIYLDQNGTATLNLATGLCQMGGALIGQNPGLISSIQARWGSSGTTNGSITGSTYTIPNVPNYNNIGATMSPDATSWRCTCPTGCSYSGQNVPISGVNYFLTNVANPWWQSQNGLVYAGATTGNALVSQIPVTCTGACIGNLSLRNALGVGESSGLVITGGGDIDADQDPTLRYGKLRQDTVQSRIIGSVYNGPRENYQYFYNLYSLGSAPISDFNGTQPGSGPANGRAYYAGSTQSINSAWLIPSGQKTVIFVNGNLNINNTITVDKGGFLSFIVNGNITVANTVGQGSPVAATSNVAAGKPSSQSSDYPLPNSQASRANDGNTNGDFTAGSVTHTLNDVNAWWQVDLGAAHNISSINVYNRTEANSARLTNYNVFVSDTPFTSTNLGTTLAQSGVSNYPNSGTAGSPSSSAVGRTGRYVRLQLNGTNYLSIAELQVVGNPVGSSGTITGNTPAVEGVYIADRIIIQGGLSGGDKKFVGAGTFVGWSGVTLGRSFADPLANDTNPSELFIFRPDFVQNVPERMTRPLYTWQETN